MSGAESAPQPASASPISGFVGGLAARSALVVAALYAIGLLLAEVYFSAFGLDARSVGLGTTELVSQTASATVWLVVLSSPGIAVALYASWEVRTPTKQRTWEPTNAQETWIGVGYHLVAVGLPVTATVLLGDPFQIGDWGIPLAAIGLGFVAATTPLVGLGDAAIRRPYADGSVLTARNAAKANFIIFSVVLVVGFGLGLAGVRQQADDAKHGEVSQTAPWSLAPPVASVIVQGPRDAQVPSGRCVVQLARAGELWTLWDPRAERAWQTDEGLTVRTC